MELAQHLGGHSPAIDSTPLNLGNRGEGPDGELMFTGGARATRHHLASKLVRTAYNGVTPVLRSDAPSTTILVVVAACCSDRRCLISRGVAGWERLFRPFVDGLFLGSANLVFGLEPVVVF